MTTEGLLPASSDKHQLNMFSISILEIVDTLKPADAIEEQLRFPRRPVKVSSLMCESHCVTPWEASLTGSLSAKSRFFYPHTMIVKQALSEKKSTPTGVNNRFCQLMVLALG